MTQLFSYPSKRYGRYRAMTLVELVMALAITAIIGVTIASMLSAVAYGTDTDHDVRRLSARGKTATLRLDAALRGCVLVLDGGDGWVVLWQQDLDGNGLPSLREIRLLEFTPPVAGTEGHFDSCEATSNAPDTAYTLDADFDTITTALVGTANFPAERWANGVTGCVFAFDAGSTQSARLVSYQLTLAAGGKADAQLGTVRLRNTE